MKIGLGQLTVGPDWQRNLDQIETMAAAAAREGTRLLVLPEGVIARDPDDPGLPRKEAQPLDGPFVTGLRRVASDTGLALSCTVHVPTGGDKAANVHIVVDHGELLAQYVKLHLYDAFTSFESDHVTPGDQIPPLVRIDDFRFGLMTCYDVRFPELARAHAVAGADAVLLPSAWVRGPLKEDHWRTMITARALENTLYVVGVGEVSSRNIGCSMVADPLGVTIAAAGDRPAIVTATLDHDRIADARASLPVLANMRFAPPALPTERSSSKG